MLFMERRMRPAILSIAELKTHHIATEAINNAIIEKVTKESYIWFNKFKA